MVDGWKVLAIVLIVVVVLETMLIAWVFKIGYEALEEEEQDILREDICIYNVCSGYEEYYYDSETQLCGCYVDGELEHYEVIE